MNCYCADKTGIECLLEAASQVDNQGEDRRGNTKKRPAVEHQANNIADKDEVVDDPEVVEEDGIFTKVRLNKNQTIYSSTY